MDDFRRFITGTAEILAIGLVVVITLGGGLVGMQWGKVIAYANSSRETGGYEFFGFLIGAFAGFASSAVTTAILFLLSSIAENARLTVELLRQSKVREHSDSATHLPAPPRQKSMLPTRQKPELKSEDAKPFVDAAEEISAISAKILDEARSDGYQVEILKDRVWVSKEGRGKSEMRSNIQILQWGGLAGFAGSR
jgi:hypothetical protein